MLPLTTLSIILIYFFEDVDFVSSSGLGQPWRPELEPMQGRHTVKLHDAECGLQFIDWSTSPICRQVIAVNPWWVPNFP